MLERFLSFLDKLSGLPRWQLLVITALLLTVTIGGFFLLRSPSRPQPSWHAAEEEGREEKSRITVHVAGAVANPGVVLLDSGARVLEAIQKAGGPLPEADLDALNLAQTVQDGQKIYVPRRGDPAAGGFSPGGGHRVNINTAGLRELEELPGIGPTLAQRIIDYREKKGGFRNVEELKKVPGIGEKKFDELRDLVEI